MAFVFFDPRKIVDVYFTTVTDSSHWHLHFIAPVWISMLTNYLENHLQREINWRLWSAGRILWRWKWQQRDCHAKNGQRYPCRRKQLHSQQVQWSVNQKVYSSKTIIVSQRADFKCENCMNDLITEFPMRERDVNWQWEWFQSVQSQWVQWSVHEKLFSEVGVGLIWYLLPNVMDTNVKTIYVSRVPQQRTCLQRHPCQEKCFHWEGIQWSVNEKVLIEVGVERSRSHQIQQAGQKMWKNEFHGKEKVFKDISMPAKILTFSEV